MLLVSCFLWVSFCGINSGNDYPKSKKSDIVMFYNVENLFDIYNDSLTNDDEFLPGSEKRWTQYRYQDKVYKIVKVIIALGGYNPPCIIGLCEVENSRVLKAIAEESNLAKYPYGIIHKDSPDHRGIDVALLYRKDKIKALSRQFIPLHFPGNLDKTSRDILYFKGLLHGDTVHFFVNHWPSRYGGQARSEPYRIYAAQVLKKKIDSLVQLNSEAQILIMGDFNDEPSNESIKYYLSCEKTTNKIHDTMLYNLAFGTKFPGTIKYNGQWFCFDQIIVSGALLDNNLSETDRIMHIFSPAYLLEEDIKYLGEKPYRTYYGPYYHGGFSDHLPVFVNLIP